MTHTFIALIEPPAGIAAWLACASFVLMLVNQALGLKARLLGEKRLSEIFPQPLEVKPALDPVTREYCDRNYNASERRIKALEDELAALRNERHEAAVAFERKIERVARDINELERRLNSANEARFDRVHARINEVVGSERGCAVLGPLQGCAMAHGCPVSQILRFVEDDTIGGNSKKR